MATALSREGGSDHAGYSKRAMAVDEVEVMQALTLGRSCINVSPKKVELGMGREK